MMTPDVTRAARTCCRSTLDILRHLLAFTIIAHLCTFFIIAHMCFCTSDAFTDSQPTLDGTEFSWRVSSEYLKPDTPAGAPSSGESNDDDCDSSNHPQSVLWTLKRDPPSYFFGTVHVPYSRVWKHVPENVKLAFHRADNVYFELDLTDRYTVMALANCQMLPQGEELSHVVPPEMLARLRRHLANVRSLMPGWMTREQKGRGLYADYLFNAITADWHRKRPVWVMLMVKSLTESDIRARGRPVLDLYLAKEAKQRNKLVGSVEQVQEQCLPLNDLNISQVLFALNHTLSQHEGEHVTSQLAYTTDDLIEQYNCGQLSDILISHDTAQVPNLLVQFNDSIPTSDLVTARQIEDYFRAELIYKRNQRMAHRITRLLKTHPRHSFFFAFGAGHFLGNNTVIDILRGRGYDIEHTGREEEPYLGADYENREYPPFLADYLPESDLSSIFVNSDLENLDPFDEGQNGRRHRQSERRRNRKKERREGAETDEEHSREPVRNYVPRESTFYDLWQRIQPVSESMDSDKEATQLPNRQRQNSEQKQYILYNSAPMQCVMNYGIFMLLLLLMLSRTL